MNALYYDVLVAVRDKVLSLNLADIPAGQVYLRQLITDRGCTLPCVLIAPFGQEQMGEGDTEDNDFGFPVALVFVAAADATLDLSPNQLLNRERVLDSFLNDLVAMPGDDPAACYDCTLDGGPIFDYGRFLDNLAVGALFFRFWARKGRNRS